MRSFEKAGVLSFSVAAAFAVGVTAAPQDASAWEPTKPIEFVIQTSPGGGSDTICPLWIGIIEKHKLSPVPITPVNMPGGAGAVALTHLLSQKGDRTT
jgi:putative tricarboxylic transport membrane protein